MIMNDYYELNLSKNWDKGSFDNNSQDTGR